MARIIESPKEYEVTCNHCYKRIAFTVEDTFQSYERGLEYGEGGWLDPDCVWDYIRCTNCGKIIAVDTILSDEDNCMLAYKYRNDD